MEGLVSPRALRRIEKAMDAARCSARARSEDTERAASEHAAPGHAAPGHAEPQIDFAKSESEEGASEGLAERARKYLERRRLREAQRMAEEEVRNRIEIRAKPEINRKSARIAEEQGRHPDVRLALYADAESQRVFRDQLVQQKLAEGMYARPAITKQAAELVREGNIADRLYQQACEKKTQQEEQDRSRQRAERARRRRSETAIQHTHDLYEQALEHKRAKEAALRLREERLRRKAKPRLSKKTLEIAADLGPSKERLLQQCEAVERQRAREAARHAVAGPDAELTFRPKINPNSKKLLENHASTESEPGSEVSSTHERLYREHSTRRQRRSTLESTSLQSRAEQDLQECTFKPKITAFEPLEDDRHSDVRNVADRLVEWERRRSMRLEEERKRKDAEPLSGDHTFAPQINSTKPGRKPSKPVSSPATNRGVEAYIERQRKAREERERVKNAAVGKTKWTNRLTVPVGPNLGTASRKHKRREPEENKPSSAVAQRPASRSVKSPPPPPPPPRPPPPPPPPPALLPDSPVAHLGVARPQRSPPAAPAPSAHSGGGGGGGTAAARAPAAAPRPRAASVPHDEQLRRLRQDKDRCVSLAHAEPISPVGSGGEEALEGLDVLRALLTK